MKLSGRKAEAFLERTDAAIHGALLFGPARGLVRERSQMLIDQRVDDASDPFSVTELSGPTLKSDPARLSDEAFAQSLIGGNRAVRVVDGGDNATKTFQALLEGPAFPNFVVIEAGELAPRSSLRKLFEAGKAVVAIGCYADEGADLERVIRGTLGKFNITATSEAVAFLAGHLGSDRLVTRAELEKLALYAGEGAQVSLEDAIACVGENVTVSVDSIVYAVASGDRPGADAALFRAYADGVSPIQILRAAQRHFQKLHRVAGLIADGTSAERALGTLRPPLIYKFKTRFMRQAQDWSPPQVGRTLDILQEAEIQCKSTGMPAESLCHRALLRIAGAATAARQRR